MTTEPSERPTPEFANRTLQAAVTADDARSRPPGGSNEDASTLASDTHIMRTCHHGDLNELRCGHEPGRDSPRGPTIKDVAVSAAVSYQTVSRYLNGHPNVRASTASRIREAIETLHYQPNGTTRLLAMSLRSRHAAPATTMQKLLSEVALIAHTHGWTTGVEDVTPDTALITFRRERTPPNQ